MLLSDELLCHVVQLLLAGYPDVVEAAVALLSDMLHCADSVRVRRLYKTGFFFFALAYTGSVGLPALAALVKRTHACQDFYGRDGAADSSQSPRNSVLRDVLPESLVCFLTNHEVVASQSL